MTDPTTLPTSEGIGNSTSEATKKLFSPVLPEGNTPTERTTNDIKISGKETENKEDWLKKEDSIVEQAKTEAKPGIPTTGALFAEAKKTDLINPTPKDLIPETKTPIIQTPVTVIKAENPINTNTPINPETTEVISKAIPEPKPATELQKDMEIIANIQNTESSNTKIENKNPAENTVAENVFNLDSLSVDIPVPKMIGTEVSKPKIPENPYDNLQKIIPQIMPGINKATGSQTKNIGIGVLLVLLILGRFVMKTMYPIQYENIISGIVGGSDEESISAEIEPTTITGETLGTGSELMPEIESGNILLDSGNTLVDSGMLENLTGNEESIETSHNAAGSENQENLEQKNTESVDDFKSKLETFVNQGKISLEEGKKTNNKEVIKYSTALYKKSESYLQNLANGEEITTDEMTNILAELSSYLVKISPATDADVSIGTETGETSIQGTGKTEVSNETTGNSVPQTETTGTSTPQNNTTTSGGGEFNPDAFFGN